MKILVIANLYPSKSDPSYGTFVKNFVDGLSDKQNVEIELCVIRGRAKNKLAKLLKYVIFLSTALYLLMFRKYDLVYNHIITHAAISLRVATFFRDIPLVFNIHGEDLLTKTRISQYGLKLVSPLLYKAKLIVVPSNFFKKKTLEIFPCINPKIIFVSASGGVSKKFFHLNTDCKISREKIVVGYVSRIDRGKGWNIFIDAIAGLKAKGMNIEGVLAGTGFQVPNMKDYINKKEISCIKYVGAIPYDDLPLFYSGLDLFVFPTMLEESLGLVGLEAMACSVPVVATEIGGITDYVKNGFNGFFFSKGNVKELEEKINRYISLNDREKMLIRKNAYNTAKDYEAGLIIDRIYEKLLSLI